ncbi:MAG: hypothetical protein ACK4QP_05305 [Pseudorhizobium sp.]
MSMAVIGAAAGDIRASGTPPASHVGIDRLPRSILISGHSLTDMPYPSLLHQALTGLGGDLTVTSQQFPGASIRQRLGRSDGNAAHAPQSLDPARPGFAEVLALRSYDVLIITERNGLLDAVAWEDTLSSLHSAQQRFRSANPGAAIYFFIPWIGVSDIQAPRQWIAYEQQAHAMWSCVVGTVNAQNAAKGHPGDIIVLPTALALAYLAQSLTSSPEVAGFEGLDEGEKMRLIFTDDVHLTPLGVSYVSFLTSAWLSGAAPPQPSSTQDDQLTRQHIQLQAIGRRFLQEHPWPQAPQERCPIARRLAFVVHYVAYTGQSQPQTGTLAYGWRQVTRLLQFTWHVWRGFGDENAEPAAVAASTAGSRA